MSDQPTTPVPTAPETPSAPVTPESAPPQTFTQEELDRIVSDRLRRAKPADYDDLKAKAERLEQFEESQKTEQQRHADAAAQAKKDADNARAETLRYKAAATHKVDPDYFDLLGFGTEDEISDRAQRVGSLLAVKAENEQLRAEIEALRTGKPAPLTGRPTPALRPGATPEHNQSEDDVLYESLFGK